MRTPHRSRPWILCVDLPIDLLPRLSGSLERTGVGLSTVGDAEEAACLFATEDPALVLLTARVPGHSGEQVERLREFFPSSPIYALVDGGSDEAGRDAVRHGAYGWFRAPLHEGALQTLLGAGFREPALTARAVAV